MIFTFSLGLSAQIGLVNGLVTDPLGAPVAGATVIVEGSSVGTTTHTDGKFSLSAPLNGVLKISFIGYQSQSVALAGKTNVTILMKEESKAIDELIVVAYGTSTKASLTGAVAAVKSEEIGKRATTNAISVLEGSMPGIQINSSFGEPGSAPQVRIRGFNSINGTNSPLYVVDGMVYSGNISAINAADIESITVLKDAASAALYGNRAANGVIVVTTKKGQSRKANVNIGITQGLYQRGISDYDNLGPDQWMEMVWRGYRNYAMTLTSMKYNKQQAGIFATENMVKDVAKKNIYDRGDSELFDPETGKLVANRLSGYDDLKWADALERLGYRQDYTISADAAGERWDAYSSFGYLSEKGYTKASDFSRFTARVNANFQPVKWFKTGVNLSGTAQTHNFNISPGEGYGNPIYMASRMAPIYPLYQHKADGTYDLDENGNKQYDTKSAYLDNRHVAYELEQNINRRGSNMLNGQVYGTITVLKDFKFTLRGDLFKSNRLLKYYSNPVIGDGAANKGRLKYTTDNYTTHTFQQQLTYDKYFCQRHHIDVLLAHENYSYSDDYSSVMKINQKLAGNVLALSNFTDIDSAEGYSDTYRTESYLGRFRYNYDNKYFVDASYRRDGSSRFHPSNRWGGFFSAGAAWMLSAEPFMSDVEWVDNLKVRLSYGQVGNDAGVDYYAYMPLYTSDLYGGLGSLIKTQNEARNIRWERSQTLDLGIDARLFDRWNITLDYFDKRSKDLLFKVNLALSEGATDIWGTGATGMAKVTRNIGSVSNKGFEFAMDVDVVRRGDWQWNIGVNGTLLRNKVLKLPDGKEILSGLHRYSEGRSIYEFWLCQFVGVDQMTGNSLYEIDEANFAVNMTAGDRRTMIPADKSVKIGGKYYTTDTAYGLRDWSGSALPSFYGNFSTNLRWKSLSLSMLLAYSVGGKMFESNYKDMMSMVVSSRTSLHRDVLNSWNGTPDGMTNDSANRIDPNGVPSFDLNLSRTNNASSDRWLQDASYLILKNVRLSYDLPPSVVSRLGVGALSLNFGVENAFTLTAIKGMNPQYSFDGSSSNTFVTARIFTFGVNIRL